MLQRENFPHVAPRAPSLLLENFNIVASKVWLRRCETTVVSQAQLFHVALKKGVSGAGTTGSGVFGDGTLAV